MTPYFTVLSIAGVATLLSLTTPGRFRLLRIVAGAGLAGVLLIFMGCRDHVGADWLTYELIHDSIIKAPVMLGVLITEPGYAICNDISKITGSDIHIVNTICAGIMLTGLFRYAVLARVDISLVFFLSTPYLLFVVGMGYTRQAVAIGLGMWAIGHLSQKHYKKSYIFFLLATAFHYSAIVLFLLQWLRTWRRWCVACAAVLLSIPKIIALIAQPRYGQYLSDQSSGVWLRLGIIGLGIIAVAIYHNRWKTEDDLYRLIKKGAVIWLIFLPLAFADSTLVDRLGLYLVFIYIAGLGHAIRFTRPECRPLVIALEGGITLGIFFIWFSLSQFAANYWIPYRIAI